MAGSIEKRGKNSYRLIVCHGFNLDGKPIRHTKTVHGTKSQAKIELAKFVDDMHRKGAKIVISNSDPKNSNTEDDFFDNIYSAHKIKRVEATRMINCNSEARGKIKELLISNF